ncbi:hypothetical protein HJC23_012780 [Cyclotella cryptica]|uniref:Uncharacterized protein n=1 Tax=Cyclotella cryptica TaxID=29204 RepID=A0ABD3Q3N2_9STRA
MVLHDDDSHTITSAHDRRPAAISTHHLSSPFFEDAAETPLEKYCRCGALDEQPIQVGNVVLCHPLQFANCFPHRSPRSGLYDNHQSSSGYLYSPSAPVGPSACEYCGKSDTNRCTSNLPGEGDVGQDENVCPRPKLFFLKKRPPFATPEGWNPKTGYRLELWEPPSSLEGSRGAWGDIRGSLNSQGKSKYVKGTMGKNSDACGGMQSGCGIYEESEVTCSSGGDCGAVTSGGGGFDGVGKSERSLSPVHWVSGLFSEKL